MPPTDSRPPAGDPPDPPEDWPEDFVWGTATASFQVEGAVAAGGRGESIWDLFTRTPGAILGGDTADVACDHYHRWPEDVEIMQRMGVGGYRFSIAWPRVVPEGRGRVNPAGLDFYDRLVDGLLEAGITPYPTLYHWDLPAALEDEGGWPHRPTAYAFADYAAAVAERLGDRVKDWWTINEPWCVAEHGYRNGRHAPGRREPRAWLDAAHHVLLAHGLGTAAVKGASPDSRVGVVLNVDAHVPRSGHPADRAACELAHDLRNRWYIDPVLLGRYPPAALDHRRWDRKTLRDGDLEIISAPLDQLGINYYFREVVADPGVDDRERPPPLIDADLPRTTMGWEIYPEGLRDLLIRFHRDYDLPPVFITENGAAFPDRVEEGAVHDPLRRDFLKAHFRAARQAWRAGVPLRGYFVWSLMDNFEWAHGFSQRFGLVWVDYDTGERIWKDSAHWFASYIAGGGGSE